MTQHEIDFKYITAYGKVKTTFDDTIFTVITEAQNTRFYHLEQPIHSYIQMPIKFKLPLRIDMRIKINAPSMYLILGNGHITFGTSFLDNRRIGDIIAPDVKKTSAFDNHLKMNEFSDLTVIYGLKSMQISINNEEKYHSNKEKYMKSPLLGDQNVKGFELKLAGSKMTNLMIESFTVTEYDSDVLAGLPLIKDKTDTSDICLSIDKKAKSDFVECISKLSPELQNKIEKTNDYLLGSKNLKIKRKIEGTSRACKISYVSSHGFSYSIHVSDDIMDHFFWWYMVSNYTYQDQYMGRKNDLTNQTFRKVAEKSKVTAEALFGYYDECVGCNQNCTTVRTIYEYNGRKKAVCHGKMIMNMNLSTFNNLMPMFEALNEILISLCT